MPGAGFSGCLFAVIAYHAFSLAGRFFLEPQLTHLAPLALAKPAIRASSSAVAKRGTHLTAHQMDRDPDAGWGFGLPFYDGDLTHVGQRDFGRCGSDGAGFYLEPSGSWVAGKNGFIISLG